MSSKGLGSLICKELSKLMLEEKANNPIKKQVIDMNRCFTKENTEMTNKHIKIYSRAAGLKRVYMHNSRPFRAFFELYKRKIRPFSQLTLEKMMAIPPPEKIPRYSTSSIFGENAGENHNTIPRYAH